MRSIRTKQSICQLQSLFARFFVVLYVVASLFVVLHQDQRAGSVTVGKSTGVGHRTSLHQHGVTATASSPLAPPTISASDRYCALCDFATHLVAPATLPQVTCQLHAVLAGVAAPVARPQPYVPFRFCDRSASRAPPAI